MLDEPGNHLDPAAIEELADTLVLVPYDRPFLESFRATRTLDPTPGSV